MRTIIVGLLLASVATAGQVPIKVSEKQQRADRERIQGEWVVVEVETADGVSTHSPYDKERGTTVHFDGDMFQMLEGGRVLNDWSKVTFTLNTRASPKRIDLNITKGQEQTTGTGIYDFDGENLVVYLGRVRPKELSAKPNKATCDCVLRMKRPMV